MANKRMFTMKIVDSDAFLDMPLSTQCLYFHLNMRADDDGFLGNPKRIMRTVGCHEDDLKLLIAKRFVLCFEDGVIVIKHWRMHNCIQKDRYTPTAYQDELNSLYIKKNKSYTLDAAKSNGGKKCIQNGNKTETKCIQNVSTDIDIDLDIDKDIGIDRDIYTGSNEPNTLDGCMNPPECPTDEPEPSVNNTKKPGKRSKQKKEKPVKHKHGEWNNVLLTDDEFLKLKTKFPDWESRIERLSGYIASTGKRYKSHYATILVWARRDIEEGKKSSGNRQNGAYTANVKTGSAEDLNNFYKMAGAWADEGEQQCMN